MDGYFALKLAVLLLINYNLSFAVRGESVDNEITSNSTELQEDEISLLFKQFVIGHNKTYLNDPKEYYKRKQIFKQSLSRHLKLNQRERQLGGSAIYGINKFSDWTTEEFKDFLKRGYRKPVERTSNVRNTGCWRVAPQQQTPPKWDWNKQGKVTSVKNQGKCGSCWAFTAVENVESQWAITRNILKELSVQELISCGAGQGCSGGNTCSALIWLKKHNYTLAPASEFPYQDRETPCVEQTKTSKEGLNISQYCCYSEADEVKFMKPVLAYIGPMAVNVDATLWHDYIGGIIQHHCTDVDINHAVQITGFDDTGDVSYWIVRNSWGDDFGDKGYLYIMIGKNLCGVASGPSYVIV